MTLQHMQIGEVAERTGLSLRTIRYYEEMGLVAPSGRSPGGFRLYTDDDVARFTVIKRMKPLDFALEEMREVLGVLDALARTAEGDPARAALLDRLVMFREAVDERISALQAQLEVARSFGEELGEEIRRHRGEPV